MKTAALLKDNKGKLYFKVSFPNSERELRSKLRKIIGYRRPYFNIYILPFTEDVIEILLENNFEFNQAFKRYQKWKFEKENPIKKIRKYKKRELKLRDYQLEGVNFIDAKNGRAILGDEMGLGKTVQALAWIQHRKELNRIIIICPSSLKLNWKEEFEKWVTRNLSIEIVDGQTPYDLKSDVIIINYDILIYWQEKLREYAFLACIADEIHYCKNPKSKRTKAFEAVTQNILYKVGLTGTPIQNNPQEIFYIVNLINKNVFVNYIQFIKRYCNAKQIDQRIKSKPIPEGLVTEINDLISKHHLEPKERERLDTLSDKYKSLKYPTRKIWKSNGVTHSKELHRILKKTVLIRRLKKDVEKELPPKVYAIRHIPLDNKNEYIKAEKDFIKFIKQELKDKDIKELEKQLKNYIEDDTVTIKELKKAKDRKIEAIAKAPALAKIQGLKMLAVEGKLNETIHWIKDFLETGEKLVVFAINKKVIERLMTEFPKAVKIDGSVSKKKRHEIVKSFQNDDKCKLFVGNMEAAGIGLTLTASSNVAILQYPWNPGDLLQAEDRTHRITQTRKVTIWKFIAKNTIEDRIVKLLEYKQDEIDKIIDGKDIKNKKKLVHLLIESYQK